jgi:hypothetical protein
MALGDLFPLLLALGILVIAGVLLFSLILALLRRLGMGSLVARAFFSFLFALIMYLLLGWLGFVIAIITIIFANMK